MPPGSSPLVSPDDGSGPQRRQLVYRSFVLFFRRQFPCSGHPNKTYLRTRRARSQAVTARKHSELEPRPGSSHHEARVASNDICVRPSSDYISVLPKGRTEQRHHFAELHSFTSSASMECHRQWSRAWSNLAVVDFHRLRCRSQCYNTRACEGTGKRKTQPPAPLPVAVPQLATIDDRLGPKIDLERRRDLAISGHLARHMQSASQDGTAPS